MPRTFALVPLSVCLLFATGCGAKKHQARATVQVSGTAPLNVSVQEAIIRADATIEPVVKKFDLAKHWMISEEDALEKVKGAIRLENVKGTDLLQIHVTDTDGHLATDIANAVTESYRDRVAAAPGSKTTVTIHEMAVY